MNHPEVVYLSGPISTGAKSHADRLRNVGAFIDAHLLLMRKGYAVINPGLTHFVDPTDALGHDAWIEADLSLVACADVVVRLPGNSRGADMECDHARDRNIPVLQLGEILE